jgi:hypothetical protein
MKTALRISAVLSFLFFALGGLLLLGAAANQPRSDSLLVVVIAVFLLGVAFFVGPILLFAAERVGRKEG